MAKRKVLQAGSKNPAVGKENKDMIDCTPTWSGILPWLFTILESDAGYTAREIVKENLEKIASIADLYVEHLDKKRDELKAAFDAGRDFDNSSFDEWYNTR